MVPFFPDYAAEKIHASPTQTGVIFALFPFSIVLASPFLGVASNR
jgi:hypothetical protein